MPHFTRLTEIVTCNLSALISAAEDQQATLEEIIREIEEGIRGAERSVRTAMTRVTEIECQIGEQQVQCAEWQTKAREALENQREDLARQALACRKQVDNLIAGLEQQLSAAISTRDHLKTTLHALQARLAEALRKRTFTPQGEPEMPYREEILIIAREDDVEEELAALRREIRGA